MRYQIPSLRPRLSGGGWDAALGIHSSGVLAWVRIPSGAKFCRADTLMLLRDECQPPANRQRNGSAAREFAKMLGCGDSIYYLVLRFNK